MLRAISPAMSLSSMAAPPLDSEEVHQNTFRDIPVESCHRHHRYYLEDGVIFRVQNTLFKVPRYLLVHESSVFKDMFGMPNNDGPEGIVDTAPIRLPQVEVTDFETLMELLYPLEFNKFKKGTGCWGEREWKSILYLTSMWQMENLRHLAIDKLDSCARPATKICLGRDFDDLVKWTFDSYLHLCLQEKPLTMGDVEGLSTKDIVGITEARERVRSDALKSTCKQFGRNPNPNAWCIYETRYDLIGAFQNELVHGILSKIFDIEQAPLWTID